MAKNKEPEQQTAPTPHPAEVEVVKHQEFLLSLMEDLDYARRYFLGQQKPAAVRFSDYYQKCRELLKEKGEEIDRKLRNG